ncbi:MAG: hypothetical protein WA051_01060 [Minisyncoccia bacterium]
MVLSVHTLVGGALGAVLPVSPVASFAIGFVSHFILDAIPHSDYPLQSLTKNADDRDKDVMSKDGRLANDLVVNGVDGILGFLILTTLTYNSPALFSAILGGLGACVPDGLQFLHFMFPNNKPLEAFKKFHGIFHTPLKVEEFMEKHVVLAVLVQGTIACLALLSIIKVIPIPF